MDEMLTPRSRVDGSARRGAEPARAALKYELEVDEEGHVTLTVPFAPGARVVVFVVGEAAEAVDDLVAAAESSLDFWDNPFDDQDWNDA